MAHPSGSRDLDSSRVTEKAEGLLAETLGPVQDGGESPQIPADSRASVSASDGGEDSGTWDPSHHPEVKDEEGTEVAGWAADVTPASPADSQQLENPPEKVPGSSLDPNGEEGGVEEVSCSSSEEEDEGPRKRQPRGTGPSPADRGEAERGSGEQGWLTLIECLVCALVVLCIGLVLVSAPLENLKRQDLGAGEILDDIRDWLNRHAQDSPGDTEHLQAIYGLLDWLVKENQEITRMRIQVQTQMEQLETLLKDSSDERDSAGPEQKSLLKENMCLRESLFRKETAHLSVQEELRALNEKLQAVEQTESVSGNLVSENLNLKDALDAERWQIKDYLIQKEVLEAKSQLLRQELDKQRALVASIRHDLDHLSSQPVSAETEGEAQQQRSLLIKWRDRLALELQRSETWERSYVENKETSRGPRLETEISMEGVADPSNASRSSGAAFERATVPPGAELPKGPIHSNRKKLNESWDQKKPDHEGRQREERKGDQGRRPRKKKVRKEETVAWTEEKDHQHRRKVQTGHDHRDHENPGAGLHSHRERDADRLDTDTDQKKKLGERGKESTHRHHDHNKFWKKLSSHQYRVPEGCTGIPDCARKEGLDHFNTELEPVKREDFQQLLEKYLQKSNLSGHLSELTSVLAGFFQGDVFSHDQMRFRDFVDDVEDYLEDIVRKEGGDDDAMDDFEDYVFRHFFGDAALKKRSIKIDTYARRDIETDHQGGKVTVFSTASEHAGEGTSHRPANADEQSHPHNSRKRPHSKEEWSGQLNKKPTRFHQESTKPSRERDVPSDHKSRHNAFNHKQNGKEEKSEQQNSHESRHHHKNHNEFNHNRKEEKSEQVNHGSHRHHENHNEFNHNRKEEKSEQQFNHGSHHHHKNHNEFNHNNRKEEKSEQVNHGSHRHHENHNEFNHNRKEEKSEQSNHESRRHHKNHNEFKHNRKEEKSEQSNQDSRHYHNNHN